MEGEGELEEHDRHLLPLAAAVEQRQQRAVMLDRLVERVVLAGAVARPAEVHHGLFLVLGGEPVVGEETERLFLVALGPAAL